MERHTIESLRILDERLARPERPRSVAARVRGRRICSLDRRGKYLLLELDGGLVVVHHLRMTGSFATDPVSHVRAEYHLQSGVVVRYRDPRRFGTLMLLDATAVDAYLDARLGPEPFDASFTAEYLRRALAGRRAPIKAALLDQRIVAGLGNIYVDEALHQARIAPGRVACSLRPRELVRVREAIVDRLTVAIAAQGSTLRDYRTVAGTEGAMQERFLACGRAGQPCVRCGSTLASARIAGRGTTWCPRCQSPCARAAI